MVRRLVTTSLLLSILTAPGASGAAPDKCPAQGGTVRAAMAGSPPTLDFVTSFAAQARDIGVYIYEGLVTIDDVRGAFPEFVAILQRTALIDRNRHWFGGESVPVQTGAVLDRGLQPRAALGR